MDLIDFIYESNKSESSEVLIDCFLEFISGFGLNRFMLADLSHDSTSDKEKNLGILVNYPEDWLTHYVVNHYVEYDPVYQKGLRTRSPFTWEEVRREFNSKEALRVMDEAGEFKLCCGIGLSIQQPHGKIIGIGFAGSEKGVRCDKDALSMLYVATHQLYTAHSDLLNIDSIYKNEINITDREREVLNWIAFGKSKAAIADILSVSESCIKRHCENMFRKLETNNLPSTVTKALRMGIIDPY